MTEATTPEQAQAPKAPDAAQVGTVAATVADTATTQAADASTEITQEQTQVEESEQQKSRSARRRERMRDRAVAAETENRILREQLAKAGQQAPTHQQAPADDGSPKREQFQTYEDYIRADATYRAELAADKRARAILEESKKSETERQTNERLTKQQQEWQEQIEDARDAIADFDDVCADSSAPVTPAMTAAIQESDKGALIAYHLAKNPEEAKRIAALKPTRQAAEIVRLEEKITKPSKAPSKAPAPISPLGKSSDADAASDTTKPEAAKKLSTAEWIKRENERMAKAGIRP